MLEEEMEQLKCIYQKIKETPILKRKPLEDEYNKLLEQMIDNGLDHSLDEKYELDLEIITTRYLFEVVAKEPCEQGPPAIFHLLQNPYIAKIKVNKLYGMRGEDIDIEILHNYKQPLPRFCRIGVHIPINEPQWFQEGEIAIIVASKNRITQEAVGRFPIVIRDNVEYCLCYCDHLHLWPEDTKFAYEPRENLPSRTVQVIKLADFEALIYQHAKDTLSEAVVHV